MNLNEQNTLAIFWNVFVKKLCSGFKYYVIVLFFALIACSEKQTNTPLSIGSFGWIGYEPFYVARDLGLYQNTAIKLVELNNSTDIMYALRAGQLDGAILTLDEVITLLHDGMEFSVVFIIDISNGADAVLTKPGISSMQELAGKQVAVEYTAMGAMLLENALSHHAMSNRDIQIVPCASDRHLDCFANSEAIVTFEPYKTKLINQGANIVFDSSQIKGQIIDVLAIRNEVLKEKQFVIKKLISGFDKALEYMQKEPDKTNQIIHQRIKLSPVEINAIFADIEFPGVSGNHELFSNGSLQKNALGLIEMMHKNNMINEPVSIDKLFTSNYLPD
ncbi:MAG: ABC transporter substrate-binding protein [Gammaproteobacteria bacterium]